MDIYLMIFSVEFSSLCREKIHEWKKSFQIKINFVGTLFLYNTFIYIRSSTTILTEDLDDSETVDYLTQTDHFLIFMQDIIWHRELFYWAQYASEDCLYTWYKYETHAMLIWWLPLRTSCLKHFVARLLFWLLRILNFWG